MMNVQDFMTSMLRDGFGSDMLGGRPQKDKPTDATFQDMLGQMGMWMMAAPGNMLQQTGENPGNVMPDGMMVSQEVEMVSTLDAFNGSGQMPEEWLPYLEGSAADNAVFLERMALLGRQNCILTEDTAGQIGLGGDQNLQVNKEDAAAGMDLSGWQLPEEGADEQGEALMPKESTMAQQETAIDMDAATSLKGAEAADSNQDQATGKDDRDSNTEILSHTLADSSVPNKPTFRNAEVHAEVPVYHHHVEKEQELGIDLSNIISNQVKSGQNELEIQLEPQNLGKITIKVSSHDNQTTIALLCSEEKTLSLLAQNAKELGAIMENNLGVPAQILVDKQAPDYLNQENNQGDNQQKEQQREKQREKKHSGDGDFIQKLRLGMTSVAEAEHTV